MKANDTVCTAHQSSSLRSRFNVLVISLCRAEFTPFVLRQKALQSATRNFYCVFRSQKVKERKKNIYGSKVKGSHARKRASNTQGSVQFTSCLE
jgi:hypothetical protein